MGQLYRVNGAGRRDCPAYVLGVAEPWQDDDGRLAGLQSGRAKWSGMRYIEHKTRCAYGSTVT